MGVTAHWVSEDFKMKSLLLAMKEMKGCHSGEEQAMTVLKILADFGISSKLHCITVDNASSNDTLINILMLVFSRWKMLPVYKPFVPLCLFLILYVNVIINA
jgi:hypothetical protein